MAVIKKTLAEIEEMKEAGRLSAAVLREVGKRCVPGVTTLELDEFAEDLLGEITAVGEFEGADTAVIAGLEDLFGDIDIRMVEDRDHAGLFHRLDDFEFAVFCHDLTYFRQR